ncbi:MAG: ERF family protein [Leucobacter sp.]
MSEKHPSLTAALAAFQAEIPTVAKGNTATVNSQKGSYGYDYADLSDVTGIVLPLLGKHGMAWLALPTLHPEHGFVLCYSLRHESGEEEAGIYPLPPASAPAQQLGAAITYARRYTLCSVTGVAPGGDDADGPPSPVKPSADWFAEFAAAKTTAKLQAVAARLRDSNEGTRALRDAYAARLGFLTRQEQQEVTHDDAGSDSSSTAGAALPADDASTGGTADSRSE